MQSLLHDDPERRIVVIIHLQEQQEGILCTNSYKDIVLGCIKCTHSDGSSPVTTSNALLPDFSCIFYLNVNVVGFISMLNVLVCEDSCIDRYLMRYIN